MTDGVAWPTGQVVGMKAATIATAANRYGGLHWRKPVNAEPAE